MALISGRVFFDPDRVGEFFTGAAPAPSVVVRVLGAGSVVVTSSVSQPGGTFAFTVNDGSYQVVIIPPQGWAPVCAGGSRRYTVDVDVNNADGLDFALQTVALRIRRVRVWSRKPA